MLILLIFLYFLVFLKADRLYLDGSDWTFRSNENNYTGKATVPGDIYTDLYNNGLINNPLYGNGDQDYMWVGRSSWIYEKIFELPDATMSSTEHVLVFDSLDTVVGVYLNGALIFTNLDLFIPVQIRLDSLVNITKTFNLTLVFESPVKYAAGLATVYNNTYFHVLPQDCNPPEYHGECHFNFIRKTQSSFSWNWGPTFATVGVAGRSYLEYYNDTAHYMTSPLITYDKNSNNFIVQVDTYVFCRNGSTVTVNLNMTEHNILSSNSTTLTCKKNAPLYSISQVFNVSNGIIKRWWPNGYGDQTMYTLNSQVLVNGNVRSQHSMSIGFRTVELIQDLVNLSNPSKGRTFYFKINDVPIFLKGSNFVPISSFPAQNHTLRKKFLLNSMKEANMNALRVWGGGLFENGEFYEMADQMGIMLWHDMMFACSLYPVNELFLDLIKKEMENQVIRLRYHPSIIVWAGNNENEVAIHEQWYKTKDYDINKQAVDYISLYVDQIQPQVKSLDPSRPFVLSSPSNGIFSEQEGGISRSLDPQDQFYGDVHYYIASGNMWSPSVYPIPRCATEFGIYSIPLTTTMNRWVNPDEWTHGSYWMQMRQHYYEGNLHLLDMIFMYHLEIPYECSDYSSNATTLNNCPFVNNSKEFLEDYAYLTQIFQAIATQTEIEHYRRYRSLSTPDERGGTMCALYWMLNDIWAAPSRASIDWDLNWKVMHYYARRFFAPVIVSMYLDNSNNLQVFVVSENQNSLLNSYIKLEVFTWENGFVPVFGVMKSVNITTVGTTQVDIQSDLNSNNITLNNNDGFVLRAVLLNQNNDSQTPVAILLPQKLRQISNPHYGDAIISSITKIMGCSEFNCYLTFAITLNASKIVPVLWVDIKPEVKEKHQLIYWFSDNAFTMTTPQVRVDLKIFYTNDSSLQLTTQDLIITRMKMRSSKVPDQSSTQSTTNPTSTLSTINLISTKSSTNLTTTQSASQADGRMSNFNNIWICFLMLVIIFQQVFNYDY